LFERTVGTVTPIVERADDLPAIVQQDPQFVSDAFTWEMFDHEMKGVILCESSLQQVC
jgi:hypothetical protein